MPYVGRSGVVEGVVADDPDRRDASVRVVLAVSAVNGVQATGKALLVLPKDSEVQYGDRMEVRGLLEVPQAFETNTGRVFDYQSYLKVRGVSVVIQRANVRSIEEGSMSVHRMLYAIKHTFERSLERVMQEPMVSLMKGLLLGEKSSLSDQLMQAFIIAGLIHIVVLSGYNIGVVAEWTLRCFALFMSRKVALVSVGVVIVLFAIMAGGGMATVRAAVMGLIAVLARYLNRPAAALRALVFAAICMVLYNPLVLVDVGFILSVLATFGLITLSPSVEKILLWLPAGAIRSTAATTVAVQLFVLPALLFFTGVLSFVSVPLNVLVLPLVPLAMLLGFLAGSLGLLHPYVALLPALGADWLLSIIITLTSWSAALPLAAVVVPVFPVWVVVAVYVPLTLLAVKLYGNSDAQPRSN
jgi:competence protein ComEC